MSHYTLPAELDGWKIQQNPPVFKACVRMCVVFYRKADRLSLLNRSDLTAYIGTKDAVLGKIPWYTGDSFPYKIDFLHLCELLAR